MQILDGAIKLMLKLLFLLVQLQNVTPTDAMTPVKQDLDWVRLKDLVRQC